MNRRIKRLQRKEALIAALAAAAIIIWRRSNREVLSVPLDHPTADPLDSTSEPVSANEAVSAKRRPRLAYVLMGAGIVVIAVIGLIVWTAWPQPSSPVAISSAKSTPSSMPTPDRTGPPCPDMNPCRISIKAIDVNTTVAAKPTVAQWDPFLGKTVASFGVPDDFTTTTWWSSGPRPGQPGMAIILGHRYDEGYGVFNHLDILRKGDVVEIRAGSSVLDYQVDAIDDYLPKTDANALTDALTAHSASENLALISCTGPPDAASHQIAANLVVFAKLVTRRHVAAAARL